MSAALAQNAEGDRRALGRALFGQGLALAGTPGATYLRDARGLIVPWPDDPTMGWVSPLRFTWAAPFSNDGRWRVPALLAAVTDEAGECLGVQATGLRADGRGKIACPAPRRNFGSPVSGAVRLFPRLLGEHTGALAVAEGVETAIGFALMSGYPTWASLGASNLAGFIPPRGVDELVIAADQDPPGLKAAQALAARVERDVVVEIRTPDREGEDWADVAARAREAWRPDMLEAPYAER